MQLPFEKPLLTSPFGNRNNNGVIKFHPGIDVIPAGSGLWIQDGKWCGGDNGKIQEQINKRLDTAIVSCLDGKVVFAGELSGGGFTVIVESVISSGDLPVIIRIGYSHLQPDLNVKQDDNAWKGQIIGYMGYSGVSFIHTHLHLGVSIDPHLEPGFIYHDNVRDPLQTIFRYQWNTQEGCNEIIL